MMATSCKTRPLWMDEAVPEDAKGAVCDRELSLKGLRRLISRGEREQARQELALVSRRDPRAGYPEIRGATRLWQQRWGSTHNRDIDTGDYVGGV